MEKNDWTKEEIEQKKITARKELSEIDQELSKLNDETCRLNYKKIPLMKRLSAYEEYDSSLSFDKGYKEKYGPNNKLSNPKSKKTK